MKRIFDLLGSIVAIIVLFPLLVMTALIVYIFIGRPILFKQRRPGLNDKIFVIYKFRTMKELRDDSGKLLPDEERLTSIGKWIRKLSLDELPQLFNVLRGDMSFVGPRPLLEEYLSLYSEEQKVRHLVKPGLTGWAQVNGRNAISWESRFQLDKWYVENWSFLLDVKIIAKTIIKVIYTSGVNEKGHSTVNPYKGNVNQGDG